jgi:hypothetical protein
MNRLDRSERPATVSSLGNTRDSAPSEARKWGSGGGSPRKYDDLLTGPSDLGGGVIARLTFNCSDNAQPCTI